jgi:hypothetical protein
MLVRLELAWVELMAVAANIRSFVTCVSYKTFYTFSTDED